MKNTNTTYLGKYINLWMFSQWKVLWVESVILWLKDKPAPEPLTWWDSSTSDGISSLMRKGRRCYQPLVCQVSGWWTRTTKEIYVLPSDDFSVITRGALCRRISQTPNHICLWTPITKGSFLTKWHSNLSIVCTYLLVYVIKEEF